MIGPTLRRHATTIVLTSLAAVAAVGVLVVDRGAVTTSESEERKNNLFEAFRRDEMSSLAINAHGERARLLRGPENEVGQRPWQIEMAGARYPAEEQAVDQLLGSLELGVVERRVPEGSVDRAGFGLDAPQITIEVTMGKLAYTLRIGGLAPLPEGSSYAEVEGRGVAVISKQLAAALDIEPSSLRSRALVPVAPGEVGALSLEGEGGERRFSRALAGAEPAAAFRFEGKGGARVARAALAGVWAALGEMEAERFLDEAAANRAFSRVVTVTLVPADNKKPRVVIELGGACPQHADEIVAIRREPSPAAACVGSDLLAALKTPAADFVDRRLFGATLDEVSEVKVERASGSPRLVEMARSGPQWHLREPEDRPLDADAGRAFVEGLIAVEAERIAPGGDLSALGLDTPAATLRLVSLMPNASADAGDVDRFEALRISAPRGDSVYVLREEDGAVLAVPKERAAALLPSEIALRDKRIFDEEARSIRALRVERGGRVQRFERTVEGSFRLVEPKAEGLSADTDLVTAVAEAMGSLTAERWVDKSGEETGLGKPRLVIEADVGDEIEAGGGVKSHLLRVQLGAPTDAGSYARAGSVDTVFIAPKRLEEAADRWLLDRGALRVDAEKIARVVLTGEGQKKLVVERAGDALRVAGAPESAAASERAAAVRDALSDMMAEGAVSVGKPSSQQGFDKPLLTITVERKGESPTRLMVGAGDVFWGTNVHYVRKSGVEATWAVARSRLTPLLEAVEK